MKHALIVTDADRTLLTLLGGPSALRRALARAQSADLVIWMVEAGAAELPPAPSAREIVVVRSKADRVDSEAQRRLDQAGQLVLSAQTGDGMEALIDLLTRRAEALGGTPALVTHARQRQAIGEAEDRIASAINAAAPGREEVVAEELRLAARALGRVTGRVDVEDVLDLVFRNFCIGK